MKKLLSILVCVLLGVTTIEAADFYAHAAAKVATKAQGMGTVCVTITNDTPTEGWSELSSVCPAFAGDANSATYNFYYHAKANEGYYFAGWSTTDGGSEMGTEMPHATGTTSGTQAAPNTDAPTYYAMFKPYIGVIQHDKMIRYVNQDGDENINNSVIIVEAKETNIFFALSGTNKELFALVNPHTAQKAASLTVPAKQGLAQVELQYLGDFNDAIGKTVDIVVTAGSRTTTLTTIIEDMPTLTFLPTQSNYTVTHTNGTGVTYTVNQTSPTVTQITEEGMLTIELALANTTNGEYAFLGWQEITNDANGNEIVKYISYDQNCVYTFNGSAQVRPEFVRCSVATFYIEAQKNLPYAAGYTLSDKIAYHDFALVMHDAEELYHLTGEPQVVVFESIYKIKGYTRPSAVTADEEKVGTLASGNYTIPKGVTLLIPGDDIRTCRIGDADVNGADHGSGSGFTNKRKLNVADGTMITVSGNLSVYAEMSYTQRYNGQPLTYGWIALGKNAHIVAEFGAIITCYGYITGDFENSSVTIENGARIHESLQIGDWRGGTATVPMLLGELMDLTRTKLFPFQQYYVQNVETRLVLHYGATERISTAAAMSDATLYPSAAFILPSGSSESSLFKLEEGSMIIKYYDPTHDRMKLVISSNKTDNSAASVRMEGILINIGAGGVTDINSANFVLPLSNNYDVALYNVNLTVANDLAFLAGTSLYVDPKAKVTANGFVFVYDADEHVVTAKVGGFMGMGGTNQTKNYFGSGNSYLTPILKRPGGMLYDRTTAKGAKSGDGHKHNADAKWVIDGEVTGKIYTTKGKAEITSNGEGKITLQNSNSNRKLKQGIQDKLVTCGDITHSLANLKNGDGSYVSGANGKTYVYDAGQGKWVENGTNTPIVDNNDYTPTFVLSTPSAISTHVGQTATREANITTTNNTNVTRADVDWSYQIIGPSANQFTAAFDDTSNPTKATVTFAPTSAGSSQTATLKIVASYVKNEKLYTYTQEVALTGIALANTNDLDFALSAITTKDGAKTLFSKGNGGSITISNAAELASYVTVTPSGNNYTIAAKDGVNDAVMVQATQAAYGNVQATTINKLITVGSGKEALLVTLNVTSSNFNQATWTKSSGVAFNNGVVMPAQSQWTVFFSGAPDKVKFTPTTTSTWQVEEFDGKGWNVLYSWATIAANKEFALSLSPSTSKVRIRCAAGGGTLSNVVVTALRESFVTSSVDTLFIPMVTAGNTYSTSVLLNYLAEELVTISTSNATSLSLDKTVLDPSKGSYKQEAITLTSSMKEPGEYRMVVRVGAVEKIIIPIIVYEVPQELPIMLATDADKYRYYSVTPVSRHATWDAKTRTITMKNSLGTSTPSLTFAFTGAPTYISFTPSTGYKGIWHIEQSADAQTWNKAVEATEKHSENTLEFTVTPNSNSQYIRVTYESSYAEIVTLSNLMIVGEPSVVVEPLELEITKGTPEQLKLTVVNLSAAPTYNFSNPSVFGIADGSTTGTIAANSVATIIKNISYTGDAAIAYGTLTISYDGGKSVVVNLVGLSTDLKAATGIYTGVDKRKYSIDGNFDDYTHHEVNIANAYDGDNKTLFDYLVIYGETKPETGTTITTPTASAGSNAITPCFIYKAKDDQTGYELHKYEENTNTQFKVLLDGTDVIPVDGQLDIYMTGFCPYASTGYTKAFEGVWYFQGNAGETVNVYLEDCHIYSRNKTEDGHPFQSKQDGNTFTESYVRGSGGVFVFECDATSNIGNPFKVNIHTRGNNVLKSNHGCFFDILGYRAYQVSSPIQIHLKNENYVNGSVTELTFDDLWPNSTTRTNGYLALKKQVNNAPSIDMGNANTVVNFRGGRVHLENAQIVTPNYQTTLAICYRSGKMGGIDFHFAHGIGTDDVGGTVKFYDGTTTVEQMNVDAKYRQYYLMDEDAEGNELTTTSCLRLPEHTYVYGGSHCMMRACQHTTSKGGAPSDGTNQLGKFEYTLTANDVVDANSKLATINDFPNSCLATYYDTATGYEDKTYGLSSVTPKDGKLTLWLPNICDDYEVIPEVDKDTRYWEACMTRISAEAVGQGGSVGGEILIDDNTEVQNMLYCKIDEYIYDAITADGYQAPVQVPSTSNYQRIPISVEGYGEGSQINKVLQNYVTNENNYVIKDRVYYVTTATADMWMTFTAPFNVENIYVIESYSEKELQKIKSSVDAKTDRQAVMEEQAKHNADFAAFYGVSMALYNKSSVSFWGIYDNFITWAKQEDKGKNLWNGTAPYDLRGKYLLTHYDGSNYSEANYYLYENTENWTLSGNDDGMFETHWNFPNTKDDILMNEGETYSILFPYCVGCGNGDPITSREYWDYWSGKFIIFESVAGGENGHEIKGSDFVSATNPGEGKDWIFENYDESGTKAILTGNSTFSLMQTDKSDVYIYDSEFISEETYYRNVGENEVSINSNILPTTSFLLATVPSSPQGMPARRISYMGKIDYGEDSGNDGGITTDEDHVPTINGGSDIFVTSVAEGINIAVSEPQAVGVFSATGQLIYSGWVETSVDVNLVVDGVYVVVGENNSVKIIY